MPTVAETMMIVEMMTGECFGEIEKGRDRTGMRKRVGSGVWESGAAARWRFWHPWVWIQLSTQRKQVE